MTGRDRGLILEQNGYAVIDGSAAVETWSYSDIEEIGERVAALSGRLREALEFAALLGQRFQYRHQQH